MTEPRQIDITQLVEKKAPNPFLQALTYCLVNGFGSFLSVFIVGYVLFYDTLKIPAIEDVSRNGEVIIICISLLFSCLYTLIENFNKKRVLLVLSLIISGVALLISLIAYMQVYQGSYELSNIDNEIYKSPKNISTLIANKRILWESLILKADFVKKISIGLTVWSVIAVFISQYFAYSNISPKLNTIRDNDLTDLQDEFKRL